MAGAVVIGGSWREAAAVGQRRLRDRGCRRHDTIGHGRDRTDEAHDHLRPHHADHGQIHAVSIDPDLAVGLMSTSTTAGSSKALRTTGPSSVSNLRCRRSVRSGHVILLSADKSKSQYIAKWTKDIHSY